MRVRCTPESRRAVALAGNSNVESAVATALFITRADRAAIETEWIEKFPDLVRLPIRSRGTGKQGEGTCRGRAHPTYYAVPRDRRSS